MAVTSINWNDGTGDKIYVDPGTGTGSGTVQVSSDPNNGSTDRTKVITFSAPGPGGISLLETVTVTQEAGNNPYAGWTDGYRLTTGGTLVADSTATVSPFFAIPPGQVYLTFDLVDTQSWAPFMAIYDADKNYLNYWGPGSGYRTVKFSAITQGTPAFLRFSMRIADKGPEFVRVRDGSFNQQNLWTGPDYCTEYDKVIFGAYHKAQSGSYTEGLSYATVMPQDVDPTTTSISFGDNGTSSSDYHYLIMYDSNGNYSNYYTQNANPRTTTDNRWKTTWHKVGKNTEARYIGKVFIKNETTNTYLFKGKSVT